MDKPCDSNAFGTFPLVTSSPSKVEVDNLNQPQTTMTNNVNPGFSGNINPPASSESKTATLPVDFLMKFSDVMAGLSDKLHRKDFIEPVVYVLGSGKSLEDFFVEYEKFMNEKYGSDNQVWAERLGSFLSFLTNKRCL